MKIVVIGGGLGGLASAARLAKLGHEVTVVERRQELGGAVSVVRAGGFEWDSGPTCTLLPAVLRDLFRKSGRPLERELELEPLDVIREHRFLDGSRLGLPGHSRAAQLRAVESLGAGLGNDWVRHVDAYGEDWDVLRRAYFENSWDTTDLPRDAATRLRSRETLRRRLRRSFHDDRLRQAAAYPFVADGHDPRQVPAWAGLLAYLEQRFGAWRITGGMAKLADALTARMRTRRVQVELGLEARDIVMRSGRAVAVATDLGEIDADAVVCAIDPRLLPTTRRYAARTVPVRPPMLVHVGLSAPIDLPHEVVLHGDPLLVVRASGLNAEPGTAFTVQARGHSRGEPLGDVLDTLAGRGIDLRELVAIRLDLTPDQLETAWPSSPLGVVWAGRRTVDARWGPRTQLAGVYAAGAHATPGAGLPFVGLSGALVAQAIGPA